MKGLDSRLNLAIRLVLAVIALGGVPAALRAAEGPGWMPIQVPGPREEAGVAWYRAWVKVPDHWTVMTGRPLYRESVTFSLPVEGNSHEVFVNGQSVGKGDEPGAAAEGGGLTRYKVPPGTLERGRWNVLVVRVDQKEGGGGLLPEAPSIQGYFLECLLAGEWEFKAGGKPDFEQVALAGKPARAAFDQFVEASRILGEARQLVPGPRLSPRESLGLMTAEDDLVAEELLTEPLVAQPTHLSFDDRGRLWVAQYRQYPYPAGLKQISRDKYYRAKYDQEPKAPPHHNRGRSRISVHEDTDGDGRYDRHKVFLDGLDLANAVLPDRHGVWVMHTPYLLFYPDENRDDLPDGDPEVHLAGFGFEDTHSVANGLVWGPDGWIYGGQG
ncbi:MAG: dehydrogenase, partial [Akkermansiaceae bacterium]|nr:dehydrogenase [Akkermansiaceae bacterium]